MTMAIVGYQHAPMKYQRRGHKLKALNDARTNAWLPRESSQHFPSKELITSSLSQKRCPQSRKAFP